MPLTFLDHRLVLGDSLTGAFWEKLIFRPGRTGPFDRSPGTADGLNTSVRTTSISPQVSGPSGEKGARRGPWARPGRRPRPRRG